MSIKYPKNVSYSPLSRPLIHPWCYTAIPIGYSLWYIVFTGYWLSPIFIFYIVHYRVISGFFLLSIIYLYVIYIHYTGILKTQLSTDGKFRTDSELVKCLRPRWHCYQKSGAPAPYTTSFFLFTRVLPSTVISLGRYLFLIAYCT